MKRKKKKKLIIFLGIAGFIFLFAVVSWVIDYIRISNDQTPIFVISDHDKNNSKIYYYGLGYKIAVSTKYVGDYKEFGSWFYNWKEEDIRPLDIMETISSVEIVKTEECNDKLEIYYTEETKKIYTHCLDEIIVSDGKNSMDLKEYLTIDSNVLNIIITNLTKKLEWSYDDGGSILFSGNGFNILKCHTTEGNNDIYIGNKDMIYLSNFCK